MITDFQGLECSDSHRGYGGDISLALSPDNDLWFHEIVFLFLSGQPSQIGVLWLGERSENQTVLVFKITRKYEEATEQVMEEEDEKIF